MADMQELIARLEAAEAGSRELDALVWLRFNRPEYSGGVKALEMRSWYDGRGHMILETDAGEEVADDLGIGTYTTSLDAALALAERVLPGFTWRVQRHTSGMFDAALWSDPDDNYVGYGRTPSPALSLCIAILKAKAQGEGQ